ncbi:MAG TPA: DEAD/DEAH box helicase, partial [Symbiobacteriaceae bacterium]|nr:DEAD/DEAH box helicase [Symbiobacteriaceae bacterium]
MPINPILFSHQVNEQFRRYQLTAFPLTDADLYAQVREMLTSTPGGENPLVKGPYVSLSRSFQQGAAVADLVADGEAHPKLAKIAEYPRLFAHQEEAFRAARAGRHCLISTGTGSGKTESFLYPIIDHCLRLQEKDAPAGVTAVLVYPMNALAQDQLDRLRRLLAGTGITYGLYVGSTPASGDVPGGFHRLPKGAGRADLVAAQKKHATSNITVVPYEERLTEEAMAKEPPRLLLTNAKQLELLLTRSKDLGMFDGAPLRFIVFDEVHTYSGAEGAEAALLIRRLRTFARKSAEEVICFGTSATLTDPELGEKAGAHFAHRFFGVDPARVALVAERYQEETWPDFLTTPSPPDDGALARLDRALRALVGEGDMKLIAQSYQELTGKSVSLKATWWDALYDAMKQNAYVRAIYEELSDACHLADAVQRVHARLGWDPTVTDAAQAHLLTYLVLGAAAERDGNPLLRPKVHYFVRGLEGVVATLRREARPRLHFSGQEAQELEPELGTGAIFPVYVCKTCGQHYFTTHLQQFEVKGERRLSASGGQREGETAIWLPVQDEEQGGARVIFTDRYVAMESEDLGEEAQKKIEARLDRKHVDLYVCRKCGTFHEKQTRTCARPECDHDEPPLPVRVVGTTGQLKRCPACNTTGPQVAGRNLEPIRPLRAVTTADVHILAQDMLGAVEADHRKLILFADNRQDAAFQAGWMQDHARRYRFRQLIWETLRHSDAPLVVGDMTDQLYRRLKSDRDLAKALAPEVFRSVVHSEQSKGFERNLLTFVRVTVLRELIMGYMQRDGLEPWGLMRVGYRDLTPEHRQIRAWATKYGLKPEELSEGIATILDAWRRDRVLFDTVTEAFSKYWRSSDQDVEQGLLPYWEYPPRGVKLTRDADADSPTYVKQVLAEKGASYAQGLVRKWGIQGDETNRFLDELWQFLTEVLKILVVVPLKSNKGKILDKARGVCQIHIDKLELVPQARRYRCSVCQRLHARSTPKLACTGHNCPGTLVAEDAPVENYNVSLLLGAGGRDAALVRPAEHTAQVPAEERSRIEEQFKLPQGALNCLVASPTLEMGVDIGALDMVLLRNVPPTASNYWQRAGRAGRRHRMAVIYTYCRRSQHDSYFFTDPMRLLSGRIHPPRFNLRNPVLVRKHIHASVLSEMRRMERTPRTFGLLPDEVDTLSTTLREALPTFISNYLYQPGNLADGTRLHRPQPQSMAALGDLLATHQATLIPVVQKLFAEGWPADAVEEVTAQRIGECMKGMAPQLQAVVDRLWSRLAATLQVMQMLNRKREHGTLTPEEEKLQRRCDGYLKGLSGASQDNYTLTVLAVEGFLPGYGIQEGQVEAVFRRGPGLPGMIPEFALRRAPAMAVREFVPGNLLYANGSRFKVAHYRFPVKEKLDPTMLSVDVAKRRINTPGNSGYAESQPLPLPTIGIADCGLEHIAHISDEEGNRFQMPVMLLGQLLEQHRGGAIYQVGGHKVEHLRGQAIRLVNVGPADLCQRSKPQLGYPVCTVCGAVRSPYASDEEIKQFGEGHKQSCGKEPRFVGFTAEAQVDGLLIRDLDSAAHAASLAEALKLGAQQVLEMDQDDLLVLLLVNDQDRQDLFIYDPMPGGSGLLSQVLDRWPEVVAAARELLATCPS